MKDEDLRDTLGLGAPRAVPAREKSLTLKLVLTITLVAVLIAVFAVTLIGGMRLGMSELASAAEGFCPHPPTATREETAPARHVAASIDTLPGVRSTTASVYKRDQGICPNPAVFVSEPWTTNFKVTVNGDTTEDELNAVAAKVDPFPGSTITLQPTATNAKLTFMLPADPSTTLPLADARRISGIPGVTSVLVEVIGIPEQAQVFVGVNRMDAAPNVSEAFEASPTPWGTLTVSDGDEFHETFPR